MIGLSPKKISLAWMLRGNESGTGEQAGHEAEVCSCTLADTGIQSILLENGF